MDTGVQGGLQRSRYTGYMDAGGAGRVTGLQIHGCMDTVVQRGRHSGLKRHG